MSCLGGGKVEPTRFPFSEGMIKESESNTLGTFISQVDRLIHREFTPEYQQFTRNFAPQLSRKAAMVHTRKSK